MVQAKINLIRKTHTFEGTHMSSFTALILAAWPVLLAGTITLACRAYLPAWLKRRAEIGFDIQIEKLRGEIGNSEARLRASLDAKQKELDSLRDAAFNNVNSRAVALENRRLQAAEAIWTTVVELMSLRAAAETAGSLKLSKVAERVNSDPKMRQFMDTVTQSLAIDKLPGTEAVKHRPFVTESVWSSYAAYSSVLHLGAVRLKMAQLGIADADEMLRTEVSNKIISTALPHQADFIQTQGPSGYHLLIEELEELVLHEIKNMLEGKEADAATVKRNSDLLKAVNEAQAKAQSDFPEAPRQ